jgi:hypothetical protein
MVEDGNSIVLSSNSGLDFKAAWGRRWKMRGAGGEATDEAQGFFFAASRAHPRI